MNVEEIAQVAHEVNRAYCLSHGDDTQPSWEEAPDWQKASAIAGTIFHISGDHPPEASHNNWMDQKLQDGWTYGAVKDPERKDIVPFNDLDVKQHYIFSAVVKALAKHFLG